MKELTKDMLIQWGIRIKEDPNEECGYYIERYGRINRSQTKSYKKLTPVLNCKLHPYGSDKYYWIVGFGYNGKPKAFSLHRLVYAYFKGDVPESMDVDHIDGNSLNNRLDNLQVLTRAENLKKRKGHLNQWK